MPYRIMLKTTAFSKITSGYYDMLKQAKTQGFNRQHGRRGHGQTRFPTVNRHWRRRHGPRRTGRLNPQQDCETRVFAPGHGHFDNARTGVPVPRVFSSSGGLI